MWGTLVAFCLEGAQPLISLLTTSSHNPLATPPPRSCGYAPPLIECLAEVERVNKAGFEVVPGNPPRIGGELAVPRAFGDFAYKQAEGEAAAGSCVY